ncbi:MAG: 4-hydroxythreonine-4-phosphate dehydrogenase PdxA [Myxococcales bacterium]|nr:4-hydroxythreonine-4-phosphate dehydrogenase PdxA [Myxococcales bacterium]
MMTKIVISCGDPAGVGLEVTLKALCLRQFSRFDRFLLYVAPSHWRSALSAHWASSLGVPAVDIHTPGEPLPDVPGLSIAMLSGPHEAPLPGVWVDEWGHVALMSLEAAIADVLSGVADAIVTAPINKRVLSLGPDGFPGQTEMLACRAGDVPVAMMLAGPRLRVVPVTTHIALGAVPARVTTDGIVQTTTVVWTALRHRFGIQRPKLMMCGLNPHAGEGGRFGDEEQRIIIPAIRHLQEQGMDVVGPFAADSLFHFAVDGGADAVICMYHDQGLIPLKLLHFHEGVNITLGLPFIRTSPDHGSAYDIADKGIARPESMIAAMDVACDLVRKTRYQSS